MTHCFDLEDGPIVLEASPGLLGPMDDAYFRHVTDVGFTGPDKGKGGKYLFVGPGYEGDLPKEGYFIIESPTYTAWQLTRAFVKDGDLAATGRGERQHARLPWAKRDDRPETRVRQPLGAADEHDPRQQLRVLRRNQRRHSKRGRAMPCRQNWSARWLRSASKRGSLSNPTKECSAILTDAVAVGNATARSIIFAQRDKRGFYFEDRQWKTNFIGGSSEFYDNGERMKDSRILFHYYATGITPAMAVPKVGTGSVYAYAERDAKGDYLDGGKT